MISKLQLYISFILVLLISSFIFLTYLGRNTLADWDEAWYADASRTMFRSGHFLTPLWNNYYFFDKPPLQYWLTQPFLWIFGETEFSYRLPSALASIGLVVLMFLWGKSRHGILGGLAASVILLSSPHFIDRGRSGNFDGLFIFLTTVSLFLFLRKKPILAGAFLGFAWMTKGIFSGFFPIVVISTFLCIERLKFKTMTLRGPLLTYGIVALLLYAPWHLLQITRFREIIQNSYFATLDQGEFGDWSWTSVAWRFDLRYLVFLWTFLRWWFPILLVSLAYILVEFDNAIHQKQNGKVWEFVDRFLPLIGFSVVFLALSAALEKNDWYIMPTYPFIALLIVDTVLVIARSSSTKLTALGLRRGNLMRSPRSPSSDGSLAMTQSKVLLLVVLFSISNLLTHWPQAFPRDKWLPERQVAEYVKSVTAPDELIVTAEYEFPTLRYYSEREVRTAAPQQDLQGKYWWVWDAKDMEGALQQGRTIATIHRPGTEWLIDVPGYEREKIGEINGRVISRLAKSSNN